MPDTANYINDLDLTYPRNTDSIGYGDNEIITVKRALKNSLPGDPTGVHNGGTPDVFNTGDGVLDLGPRYMNSIPGQFDTINTTLGTMADDIADLQARKILVGMIMMWSGSEGTIPVGWQLCDGTNGTPNLQDKFVIGAGNTYNPADTGGAASVTSGAGSAHSHTITVDSHTLTVAEIPTHGHPYVHNLSSMYNSNINSEAAGGIVTSTQSISGAAYANLESAYSGTASSTTGQQIGGTGGGGGHSHTGSSATESAHTHSVATLPPYYALCFIMYVGV